MKTICQPGYQQRALLHELYTPTQRILQALQSRRVTARHVDINKELAPTDQAMAEALTIPQQHWSNQDAYNSNTPSACTKTPATLCYKGIAISRKYEKASPQTTAHGIRPREIWMDVLK